MVATAGYRFWQYWQDSQAQASGERFVAALKLGDQGKHQEAIAALTDLTRDGSGGYPVLAGFRVAAEKAAADDTKGAVNEYDAIAARGSAPALIRDLARLRAALLLAESASPRTAKYVRSRLRSRLNESMVPGDCGPGEGPPAGGRPR